jgi:hypothetical protein
MLAAKREIREDVVIRQRARAKSALPPTVKVEKPLPDMRAGRRQ